jgi:hypothetical protein
MIFAHIVEQAGMRGHDTKGKDQKREKRLHHLLMAEGLFSLANDPRTATRAERGWSFRYRRIHRRRTAARVALCRLLVRLFDTRRSKAMLRLECCE